MNIKNKYFIFYILIIVIYGCSESKQVDTDLDDRDNRPYWRYYHVVEEFNEDTEFLDYVPYYADLTNEEKDTLIKVLEFYSTPYFFSADSNIFVEKSLRGIQNYDAMYTTDSELRRRIKWEEWESIKETWE